MLSFSPLLGGLIHTTLGNAWNWRVWTKRSGWAARPAFGLGLLSEGGLAAAMDTTQQRCRSLLPERLECLSPGLRHSFPLKILLNHGSPRNQGRFNRVNLIFIGNL
jgi:hypothetical protein